MSDSTNILDLLTDPVGGGNISNNINIKAQDINETLQSKENQGMTLDQTTIDQIINGLQQATLVGATKLPSRDIPMNTSNISVDPQVMPNYVPQPPSSNPDYIQDYEKSSDMVNKYNRRKQMNDLLDDMYNEIQTPLLLSVLYFLFQLPFFKKILYSYTPFLFSNDGNYNINGYLFTSILFGILYHLLMKTTSYFGTF
jgi:replicative DNA helicase